MDPSLKRQLNQFERPPPGPRYAPGLPTDGWLTSPYVIQGMKVVPRNLHKPPTVYNRSQHLTVPRQINTPY